MGVLKRRILAAVFSLGENPAREVERRVTERHLRILRRRLAGESLVQSFAVCTHYIPAGAVRIFDGAELPLALERIAASVTEEWKSWLAWTDRRRIWFVVAEMEPASAERADRSVKLFFYDDDGRIISSGIWVHHPNGNRELLPY